MSCACAFAGAWIARSANSYLHRLARQGLLERAPWGRLAYRLTSRGHARLDYLKEHPRPEQP